MQKYKAMMEEYEIMKMERLLNPDMVCLEFGSGYSTAYFPKFVDLWVSIEHDQKWYDRTRKMLIEEDISNVVYLLRNKTNYNRIGGIDFIKEGYDLILVDGYDRENSLKTASELINRNGIILLHDYGRQYFHLFNKYKHKIIVPCLDTGERGLARIWM
jgi:predicted O-methyltransferase YrrM